MKEPIKVNLHNFMVYGTDDGGMVLTLDGEVDYLFTDKDIDALIRLFYRAAEAFGRDAFTTTEAP